MSSINDLTQNERNFVYNKLMSELMNLGLYDSKIYVIYELCFIGHFLFPKEFEGDLIYLARIDYTQRSMADYPSEFKTLQDETQKLRRSL